MRTMKPEQQEIERLRRGVAKLKVDYGDIFRRSKCMPAQRLSSGNCGGEYFRGR